MKIYDETQSEAGEPISQSGAAGGAGASGDGKTGCAPNQNGVRGGGVEEKNFEESASGSEADCEDSCGEKGTDCDAENGTDCTAVNRTDCEDSCGEKGTDCTAEKGRGKSEEEKAGKESEISTENRTEKSDFESSEETDDKVLEFSKLFAAAPKAEAYAEEIGVKLAQNGDSDFFRAYSQVLESKLKSDDELLADGEFLRRVSGDGRLRAKIIGDYLKDVAGRKIPVTIGSGGSNLVTPPERATTLSAARELVRKMAENGRMR